MKKLRFVSLMVAALFMGLSFTSCEEDGSILATEEETDEDGNVIEEVAPEIVVNEGETDDATVYVNSLESSDDQVIVTVQFLSSETKMNRLYITENIAGAGAEKYELEIEDLAKKGDGSVDLGTPEEYELKFDIPFPVYSNITEGTVEYQIWATSGRGDYRDMDKRLVAGPGTITIEYGDGVNPDEVAVKEYSAVLLAAPTADKISETFISLIDGEIYPIEEGEEYAAYWDFGYYYGGTHKASLASTSDYPSSVIDVEEVANTTSDELNDTYFAISSLTVEDFSEITLESELEFIEKPSSETIKGLEEGNVIEFVDNYGNKGLIKVSEIKGTYNAGDYIKLDIKVQP